MHRQRGKHQEDSHATVTLTYIHVKYNDASTIHCNLWLDSEKIMVAVVAVWWLDPDLWPTSLNHMWSLKHTPSCSNRRESVSTMVPSAIMPSHVLLLVFSFSEMGMEGLPEAPHFSHCLSLMGLWWWMRWAWSKSRENEAFIRQHNQAVVSHLQSPSPCTQTHYLHPNNSAF